MVSLRVRGSASSPQRLSLRAWLCTYCLSAAILILAFSTVGVALWLRARWSRECVLGRTPTHCHRPGGPVWHCLFSGPGQKCRRLARRGPGGVTGRDERGDPATRTAGGRRLAWRRRPMARWFVDRQPQQGIPSVSLRRLLPEARFVGCEDFEVSGCTADSRRLDPGQVFVAVRGERHDGHAFVAQAMERGAAGVVVERPVPEAGRLQVVVPDSRAALARLCQALAGDPSEQMLTLGVTGVVRPDGDGPVPPRDLRGGRRPVRAGEPAGLVRRRVDPARRRGRRPGPRGWRGCSPRWSTAAAPGPSSSSTPRRCGGVGSRGSRFDAAVVSDVGAGPGDVVRRGRRPARGDGPAVPPGRPRRRGGGQRRRPPRRAPRRRQPRRPPGRLRPERRRPTSPRGSSGSTATGSRFRLRGFDREAAVTLRLAGRLERLARPGGGGRGLVARGRASTRSSPGSNRSPAVPGRLEPVDEGQGFDVRVDQARDAAELHEALACLRATGPRAGSTASSAPRGSATAPAPGGSPWPPPPRPSPTA